MEEKEIKQYTFMYPLWRIASYFVIYSICGFIIETAFGLITKGIIESRQSMLYGPFCNIYGVGAVLLLCIPSENKKNWQVFWAGCIVGSLVEYIISWGGEALYNVKWWDYSNIAFNLNGRICLAYSVIWGGLTIALKKYINPIIDKYLDKFIEKIKLKNFKRLLVIVIFLMFVDQIISSFAMKMFYARIINNNDIKNVVGADNYTKYFELYQKEEDVKKIVDKFFDDKKMLRTFPNLKLTLEDGSIILVRDILKDIKPYYIKVFEPHEFKSFEFNINK